MNNDSYQRNLQAAVALLRSRFGDPPPVALVLGSGLGGFLDDRGGQSLRYEEIPGFPVSTVVGHAGRLSCFSDARAPFCALLGRSHGYEGLGHREIVLPVRALALWGVRDFVITNAAGAINADFAPGDLMVITDHINLSGDNPLVGPNLDTLGERFPDMTKAYDPGLQAAALEAGKELGVDLKTGVYVCLQGPSYETPAEIRMLRTLGADAVGMSTVPEVISLNHMGRRVLGISCLTNFAAGLLPEPVVHEEVLETAQRVMRDFESLVLACVEKLGRNP